MKALIQRVSRASVSIAGTVHNEIGKGMLIFLGVSSTDDNLAAESLAQKVAQLRIFEDEEGKMNRSVKDVNGSTLVISQFTLYADTAKGNRPSFIQAARPQAAEALYGKFVEDLKKELGEPRVRTGVFRAMMDVELINNGPVTLMIESKNHAS
jgi:D-tyrosyl-tRNA(Tyr) deacylase